MLHITIPVPEKVSSNAIYSGMHWAKRKALADLYHNSLIEYRNERITDYPVTLSFIFNWKSRALDCSNTFFCAKLLEDALVQMGVLKDDSPQYVFEVSVISQKGERDEVTILIH